MVWLVARLCVGYVGFAGVVCWAWIGPGLNAVCRGVWIGPSGGFVERISKSQPA